MEKRDFDSIIILASKSKRRSAILKSCSIPHRVVPSRIRELHPVRDKTLKVPTISNGVHKNIKRPEALVMLNAGRKAEAVARRIRKGIMIGVDTLALFKGRLVGKPHSRIEAKRMLEDFSGNRIIVYSGICVINTYNLKKRSGFDKTSLYIRKIPRCDMDKYFRLLGPYDKAGGFSIEGIGSIVFDDIRGSYFNVLGLPMGKLQELFRDIGLDLLDFVRK